MNEKDFKDLVLPLQRQMYAVCFSILRDESVVSDCLQDVMTRLWEHRSRLKKMDNPGGYCMVVAKRAAIDIYRRHTCRITDLDSEPPDITDPSATPSEQVEARDRLQTLTSLLEQLPPRQREVVEMSGISGLSNSEIEEATGLSGENVRVLLSRGRKRLKELFGKIR